MTARTPQQHARTLSNAAGDHAAALVEALHKAGMPRALALVGIHAEIVTQLALTLGADRAAETCRRSAEHLAEASRLAAAAMVGTHAGGRA